MDDPESSSCNTGKHRMAANLIASAKSRFVHVDDIRTHYLDAGDGAPLIMLHDGAWGASGEISWFLNFDALAKDYRVIAPDWLGFGATDKIHDFCGGRRRRLRHMTRFLETLDISSAAFAGCSMGATTLLQVASAHEEPWPIAAAIVVSGGGHVPLNDSRVQALSFDCTLESMRKVVSTLVHDQKLLDDRRFVETRFEQSIRPGAWEAIAAARFKSPISTPPDVPFGKPDTIAYEAISAPTLLVAGANDKLLLPGYAEEIAARIAGCELAVFQDCGHMPHMEYAERFNAIALDFLKRRYQS
jgi:pimeloyl-ACP methyl ester carboxylesterase